MQTVKLGSESLMSIEGYTRLLTQVASGVLDGLQCPECDQRSVSVCLTPHHANEYRSWFICTSCDFRSRAHNRARPSSLAKDRAKPALQIRPALIRPTSIFKRPVAPLPD
jgi:hypothetical protein